MTDQQKNFYLSGIQFYESVSNWQDLITEESIKRAFLQPSNFPLPRFIRSKEFYQSNYDNGIKSEAENRKFRPNPFDDFFLRKYILPKLPKGGRTAIPIAEIDSNWHNPEWWFNNFRDVLDILESQYIKIDVRESFKNLNGFPPKGIYHNWLTRQTHWINTPRGEYWVTTVKKLREFLELNGEQRDILHSGRATDEECQTDLQVVERDPITGEIVEYLGLGFEVKICTENAFQEYLKKLTVDFDRTLRTDYHYRDDMKPIGAIYIIKGVKGQPLKLYTTNFSNRATIKPYDPNKGWELQKFPYIDQTFEFKEELAKLDLLLMDDDGKMAEEDYPALPKPFLFGLRAKWLKSDEELAKETIALAK